MLASKTKMFQKVVNKKVYENVIKVKCNSCIFKLFHLQSGSQGCSFSKQSIWSGVQSRPYSKVKFSNTFSIVYFPESSC